MEQDPNGKGNYLRLELNEEEWAHFEQRAGAAARTLEEQLRYELGVGLGLRLPDPGDREATQRGQFFRRQRTHQPLWG
jgi:hypothetical protein